MRDSTPSRAWRLAYIAPRLLSAGALLVIWKIASLTVASNLILPPPEKVATEFLGLLVSPIFRQALGATALRGLIAFSLSALLGLGLGLPAGLSPVFRGIIAPPLALIRSTPVVAIILLLLFWFREEGVPVVSAVLMAFPVLLSSVSEGVRSADPALLEMAAVFKMRKRDALRAIRLPSLLPFFISGTNGALGLVWKVVVAGEVLSLPSRAIGTGLHDARIYLDIPKAMAWTVSAILLCVATDAVFALAAKGARRGV